MKFSNLPSTLEDRSLLSEPRCHTFKKLPRYGEVIN